MGAVRAASTAIAHAVTRSLPIFLLPWIVAHGAAAAPLFGQHYPHGQDAVEYLYGPNGTWRAQTDVYYGWNYYKHCETPAHAYNPSALLLESSARNSTAPDANCIILNDLDNDGEIADEHFTGQAFHEHSGRGVRGEQVAPPFYQFWFDDNWVARYVAEAYGRPHPIGLHDFGHQVRWRVMGGDNRYWTPYSASTPHIDQIAFNGLYKYNAKDFDGALADWRAIRERSGAVYNETQRRYEYSFAPEAIYYYGMWAILSERLLAGRSDFPERSEVLQHAMSLHSWLLTLQERDAAGNRLAWRTGTNPNALINTETTSVAVLALAAHASFVLEPGHEPLLSEPGNYTLANEVLSAVAGRAVPGHMVFGPYWSLEPGTYDVEFSLRSSAERIDAPLATLDVYDGGRALATTVIEGADAPVHDRWRRYRLTARIERGNRTEFRVYWHGAYDLDVGHVRVIRRSEDGAAASAAQAPGASATPMVAPALNAAPFASGAKGGRRPCVAIAGRMARSVVRCVMSESQERSFERKRAIVRDSSRF